ncbi:hypothetical protein HG535_0B04100 [Zygotorulaspora mrakii]|uniref:non-specific serine/threonine protein kinase n=1 Tax=Zygotorulaspora mrakii TaxID=42260 RepID=A0A7H9AY75_ZYGMR|nr:uncharacterized protein HG535_0B04100 [Zygotorulaspora mrakii]QLG71368.1 hypothetical protein HG535_0B04100 [Zygotorulaspora mrakii]
MLSASRNTPHSASNASTGGTGSSVNNSGGVSRKNTLSKMAKLFGSNSKSVSQIDVRSGTDVSNSVSHSNLSSQSSAPSAKVQTSHNGSNKQKKSPLEALRPSSPSPPPMLSSNIYHNSASSSHSNIQFGYKKQIVSPQSSSSSSITSSVSATSLSSNSPTSGATSNSKIRSSSENNNNNGSSATASSIAIPATLTSAPSSGRFIVHADGTHEHHLKSAKRQEKLSSMIKNMVGAQKIRGQAKSAVPDIMIDSKLNQSQVSQLSQNAPQQRMDPPTLFAGLMKQMANQNAQNDLDKFDENEHVPISGASNEKRQFKNTTSDSSNNVTESFSVAPLFKKKDSLCFAEKYGRCQEVLGKGAFGVVRICHKKSQNSANGLRSETLFAVKEFKRRATESSEKYSTRLTSEFCISSSLRHTNIITTLDLFQDAKGDYCEVMEYCAGGDLFTLIIAAGKLEYLEADCFFKQLIRGVVYMHDMGVCHRDLKPENLLLKGDGTLKIIDFGNSECFKMAWEKDVHLSAGICGSSPYIAPEEYSHDEFDPRPVDIWACGVIYMAMRTGRQLWRVAQKEDEFYAKYLKGRKEKGGYEPVENLKRARCRNVIYSMLDPVPHRRINAKQILNSEWGREIKCCNDGHALK